MGSRSKVVQSGADLSSGNIDHVINCEFIALLGRDH